LLHGWPDDPTTWDQVSPALTAAGFRTIAPWLRGFGPTRFRSAQSVPYRRLLLDSVGHFPTREAPAAVAEELLKHLRAAV
jgi:pimeloyl-ACP methyl ester carboxylesterase